MNRRLLPIAWLVLIALPVSLFSQSTDCCTAQPLMGNMTVTVPTVAGPGNISDPLNSCTCLATGEHDTWYFVFECVQGGTFEMMITPNGLGADYDFALVADACPCDGSQTVACDYTGPINPPGPFVPTGISSTPMATFGVPGATEFQPTVTLQAGTIYYIIADNITGNDVGFEIQFAGTAVIGPPPNTGGPLTGPEPMSGDFAPCPGGTFTYSVPAISGFNDYTWTTTPAGPSIIDNGQPTVQITWPAPGVYQLCVEASDACNTTDPTCETVVVTDIVTTPVTAGVCLDGNHPYPAPDGNTYTAPGTYMMHFTTANGCDSNVMLILEPLPFDVEVVVAELCEGECVTVAGETFCENGFYTITLTNQYGCDSIINVNVVQFPAEAVIHASPTDQIDCLQDTVWLDADSSIVSLNTQYRWYDGSGALVGTGSPLAVTVPDTYVLEMSTEFGSSTCVDTDTIQILDGTGPPPFTAQAGLIGCDSSATLLTASSPDTLAAFLWTGPLGFEAAVADTQTLLAGDYTLYVTGGNGCTDSVTLTVAQDAGLPGIALLADTITCNQPMAAVAAISGQGGISYSWSGPSGFATADSAFTTSAPGLYQLVAATAGGCADTFTVEVVADISLPSLAPTQPSPITCAQPQVSLSANGTSGVAITWSGPGGFSASGDTLTSVPGTYVVFAEAPNGCSALDSITITIDTVAPQVLATGGTIDCQSQSLTLGGNSATAGVSYAWTGPGAFSSVLPTPSVTQPGVYTLTVTAPNGCTAQDTALVLLDADLPDLTLQADTITCFQPLAGIMAMSGTSGVSFVWSGPGGFSHTGPDAATSTPGWYYVTATAPNGCSRTDSIEVIADLAVPDATATADTLTCAQPVAALAATSATPGATFAWTGPGGFTSSQPLDSVTQAGTYQLVVTAPNGCTTTLSVEVVQDAGLPDATAMADTISCAQPQATLTGSTTTPGATLSWSGPDGFSATGGTATTMLPGLYTLAVTAPNNCVALAEVEVVADTLAPDLLAQADTITCAQPEASLSANSATAGVSYAWSGPNGFTADAAMITTNEAGTYAVTVTAPNGCSATEALQVVADTLAPALAVDAAPTLTCAQSEASLSANSATAGVSYAWSGPGGFTSDQPDPLVDAAGTYAVTATAPNGCTATASVVVQADFAAPDLSAQADTITCMQPQASLTANSATPGVAFSWTGPGGFNADQAMVSTDQPGTYTVTAVAPNGCSSSQTVEVALDADLPDLLAQADTLTCAQPEASLSANSTAPGVSYAWSGPDGFTAEVAMTTTVQAGTYSVTVTAPNGCWVDTSVVVVADTIAPDLLAEADTITCAQPEASLSANSATPVVSYAWSGPNGFTADAAMITTNEVGTYAVTITAPNGCSATETLQVVADTLAPALAVDAAPTLTCAQPEASLSANSATPGVTYSWTGPGGFTSDQPDPLVDAAGTYVVTATAPNGCTATASVAVQADFAAPDLLAQADTITCAQPQASLSAISATPGVTYAWSGPGGFTSDQPEPLVDVAGTYSVTVTAPNGCMATASVAVQADTQAPVLTGQGAAITCLDPQPHLMVLAEPADADIDWSGPGGFTATGGLISVEVAGTYTATATGANGCTATLDLEVTDLSAPPVVSIAPPAAITCLDPEVTLEATITAAGPYEVQWTTADGLILAGGSTPSAIVGSGGNYTIVVTDTQSGCTAEASVLVSAQTEGPTDALVTVAQPDCVSAQGALYVEAVDGGTAPYTYQLNDGLPRTTPVFDSLPPGTHLLTIADASGCVWSTQVTLHEPLDLTVSLESSLPQGEAAAPGEPLTFNLIVNRLPEALSRTDWQPAALALCPDLVCLQAELIADTSTLIRVEVMDTAGCVAVAEWALIVRLNRDLYAPNVFSPNDDGFNDRFTIYGAQAVRIRRLEVYDRWGEPVFLGQDLAPGDWQAGWDGTARGKPLPQGVYVFRAEVELSDGSVASVRGDVTLVR